MTIGVNVHTKDVVEFRTEGYATTNAYAPQPYPVFKIAYRDANGIGEQDITFFPTREQLVEMKKGIDKALRALHHLDKLEKEKAEAEEI